MSIYGIENCTVEIIEDNFKSIVELALAEIKYIEQFDSFKNGLNSTRGGDGMGRHILHLLSESDIERIKTMLGDTLRDYNNKVWANTTVEDRKELTKHLHTEEVYQKKSDTLKKFYEANPKEAAKKKEGIVKWQQENRKQLLKTNKENAMKGAAKVSKKLLVEMPDGSMLHFPSKSEFTRQTGQWTKTIIQKTQQGESHNGYKAWEQ